MASIKGVRLSGCHKLGGYAVKSCYSPPQLWSSHGGSVEYEFHSITPYYYRTPEHSIRSQAQRAHDKSAAVTECKLLDSITET